ncbi:MAG: hypothetical protein PHY16_16910 [Methylobacter sp.]|nr:hypothetical protein [Methylobacter sp.]
MKIEYKRTLEHFLAFLVVGNTVLFLLLAYFHLLSTAPKAAVFIDFWGRFTVYSMWFIGFAIYLKFIATSKLLRVIALTVVCINIPLFLVLAYFDKISNTPDTIVFVDFWGRITVYSLWVICYEFYKNHIAINTHQSATPSSNRDWLPASSLIQR